MKKTILVCAIASIYVSSFAQNNTSKEHKINDNTNKNCAVKMEDGKMMMTVDEKTVIMDKEMTLKNGSVVMMDGTVRMKDGKAIQMKEGDCMDMSGKMILVKNTQIKKD